MRKVELYETIRREHFLERKSIRQIAREQRIHRRDVRQAIASAIPAPRKPTERPASKLGPYLAMIDAWLLEDQKAWRKQHHTSRRMWQRLVNEHGFSGAESTIRRLVGQRRRALGLKTREVFIEQEHIAGVEAEVDFGEVDVVLSGHKRRVHLLFMRCCYSARTQVIAFERESQQCFLEGMVRALTHFGGVFERLRFDNLSSAVKTVLRGRQRVQTERFVAFRSHYLLEAIFCRPGKVGAHEKGGVEGEVGRFRRNHLVPMVAFPTLEALNAHLQACCEADMGRTRAGDDVSVAQRWSEVHHRLRPLPAEPFDTSERSNPLVDCKSRVQVSGNRYSVPTAFVGQRVEAIAAANVITLKKAGQVIGAHPRLMGQHQEALVLEHYLDWLRRKPGAMPGSKVLAQARR